MTFLLSLAQSHDAPPSPGAFTLQRLARRPAAPSAGTPLEVADVGGVLVLSGEVDLSTRDLVTGAVRRLRVPGAGHPDAAHYRQDVILHLGAVTFVDASGLGALVALSAEVGRDGRRLRLLGVSRELRRLSGLCELDTVLGLDPG